MPPEIFPLGPESMLVYDQHYLHRHVRQSFLRDDDNELIPVLMTFSCPYQIDHMSHPIQMLPNGGSTPCVLLTQDILTIILLILPCVAMCHILSPDHQDYHKLLQYLQICFTNLAPPQLSFCLP